MTAAPPRFPSARAKLVRAERHFHELQAVEASLDEADIRFRVQRSIAPPDDRHEWHDIVVEKSHPLPAEVSCILGD